MITRYITYCKPCPADENKATEFEFVNPEPQEEHDSVSHELVDVQVSGGKIYYTFRLVIKFKGINYAVETDEDQEVSPFER